MYWYLLAVPFGLGALQWGIRLSGRYKKQLAASPLLTPMSDEDMAKFLWSTRLASAGVAVSLLGYMLFQITRQQSLSAGVLPLILAGLFSWLTASYARLPATQHLAILRKKASPAQIVGIYKRYYEQNGRAGLRLVSSHGDHCVDLVTAWGKQYHFFLGSAWSPRDALAQLITNFGPAQLDDLWVEFKDGRPQATTPLFPSGQN